MEKVNKLEMTIENVERKLCEENDIQTVNILSNVLYYLLELKILKKNINNLDKEIKQ